MPARCFKIHPNDNVATLLDDAVPGASVKIIGGDGEIIAGDAAGVGHKLAIADIANGSPVVKFGVRIGRATRAIREGQWVHLHNLASDFDVRSQTFDVQSGAITDTKYE